MLTTHSLTFSYPTGNGFNFPDIHCGAGESLLILGESGKGKTTFLHLLAGLLRPASGEIIIGDTHLEQLNPKSLDRFRGRNIGLVFQKGHFISSLTVGENLLMTRYLASLPKDESQALAVLDRLNLNQKYHAYPQRLSQGEQQRVAIARAVLNHPKVILADEPTSALDDHNCEEVINLLEEHAAAVEAALVIVTHDSRLKDRIPNQLLLV